MFWTLRWGRIVLAAVLSEAGVIAALLIAIAFYSKVIAPASPMGRSSRSASVSATTLPPRQGS